MNVLHGRLIDDGGWSLDLGDGANVPLPGARIAAQWRDRDMAVGIRPEHLLPNDGADIDGSFAPEVEVVEPVGNEVFLYLRHGPMALVTRSTPQHHQVAPGDRLPMRVSAAHLHFFDPATGRRLEPA